MKYLIQVCICAALFCACHPSNSSNTTTADSTVVKKDSIAALLGTYKGDFDGKAIYITINYANNGHIAGYNVVNGLRRNLSGTFEHTNSGFETFLSEPGDHPYDGKFAIHFDEEASKATGTWTPLNTAKAKEKSFSLDKVITDDANSDDNFIDYALDGNHRDITFNKDGSVVLNYYDMLPDSSFTQQMNTINGSWEKKGDSITVSWHKKGDGPLPATIYYLTRETGDSEDPNDKGFLTGITSKDSIMYYAQP